MEKELKSLPSDTVRLIGSSQVITSIYSVVKELVENALDSTATSVEIKLENYGLDKVEVRDNGHGIKNSNMEFVAKRYHTSKISSFNDLESLSTYGFRGEALGSLCAVSSLCITSKTSEEAVSFTYSFDHHGNIVARQPSHLGQGTTVCATQLFKNLPVRRQFYNTLKKKKEELKKIEDLIMAYGAIKLGVRFLLKNRKDTVWQKNGLPDTRSVLLGIMGRNVMSQMEHDLVTCENIKMKMEYFFPGPKSNTNLTSRSTNDRCFIAVNERPVQVKEIEKLVKQYYCSSTNCEGRFPVFYLSLNITTTNLDVNIDPNKTRVMLHDQKSILSEISTILEGIYGPLQDKKDNSVDTNRDISLEDSPTNKSVSNLNDSDSFPDDSYNKQAGDNNNLFSTKGHVIKYGVGANYGVGRPIDANAVKTSSARTNGHSDELNKVDSVERTSVEEHTVSNNNQNQEKRQLEKECGKEFGDSNISEIKSVTNHVSEREIQSKQVKPNNDIDVCLSTQKDQMNFDFLDHDLEDLLNSQKVSNKPVDSACNDNELEEIPAELFISFSEEQTINNNITEDSLRISNKENTVKVLEPNALTNTIKSSDCVNGDVNEGLETKDMSTSNKLTNYSSAAEKWTTGKGVLGSDGKILQPVTLLAPNSSTMSSNKRPLSDLELTAFTPPPKRKSLNVEINQPRLYDIVGKSPKEKYSLGFTAFSREERPKVLDENPDLSYDEITKLVGDKWNQLDDIDKKQYEDQGKIQVDNLKKKVQEKQRTVAKPSKKIEQHCSIKDKMLSTSRPSTDLPPIQTVKVKFSLQRLTDIYHHGKINQSQNSCDTKMSLVGPLKFYNGWICFHDNKLQVINPHRVEETILFQELMENHVISSTKLENPIKLDESNLGQSQLKTLIEMISDDSCQTYVYINDKRMTSNGFKIRCHVDENNHPVLELDSVCKSIPTYGVSDLKKVLGLIKETSASTLKQCRPLKVIYYLQGEAVRMVRQRPLMRSKEDMVNILEQMESSLPQDCVNCLHDKHFLHAIYDMNDIPTSQLTQV